MTRYNQSIHLPSQQTNSHFQHARQQRGDRRNHLSHRHCKPKDTTKASSDHPELTFILQLGTAVGGLSRTVGGVVGTAGRGVGQTINNTTGTKAVGDGLQGLTDGLENGVASVARVVEDGSKGKKVW